MKNLTKKLLSLSLATCMVFSLAACGGKSEPAESETPATESSDATTPPSLEGKKVGVVMTPLATSALVSMGENIDNMVECMGGETQWEDTWDFTSDGLITGVESLITAGCNGIIICPPADDVLPKVMQLCEEAGVYWTIIFRSVNNEEIANMLNESEYYIGNCYEDEEAAGYAMGASLGEQGCKEVAIISTSKGDSTGDTREIGFNKACEEYGITVVAEARALLQSSDVTKATESFMASYENLDGIALLATLCNSIEPATQAIESAGKTGEIFMTCNDFADGMEESLEKGIMINICGGHQPFDPTIATAMLCNAIQGTPITEDKFSIKVNVLYATSNEIVSDYFTYVEDDLIYYQSEIDTMFNKALNPEITVDDIQALASSYSTDDLRARHGDK